MELIIWAILFVLFVIAEVVTIQLVSIWLACGSLITLICTYFFDIPFIGQLAIFIISSAILLGITFPLIRKKLNTKIVGTNSELDIGQSAAVIEEINTDLGTGRVTLNGVDWSAVPGNKNEIIPVGSIVTVKEVHGAKLIVALKEDVTVH